jgi:glycosyltransferase involved in cell wall biosynthesis
VHARVAGTSEIAIDPADYSFTGLFLAEVSAHFDSVLLFGRTLRDPAPERFVALRWPARLAELPYYPDLTRLPSVARATVGTAKAFWRGLASVDTVWVFGPHPFALVLIALARLRGRNVVLGVRQDTVAYFRARLPSPRWVPALVPLRGLDAAFRLLARRTPTTVVAAPEIAGRYSRGSRRVLAMIDSVLPAEAVVTEPPRHDWTGPIELLTVGRLEPEKNPLLLVEAIAALDRLEPGRFRLSWVGGGPMEDVLRRRADELGVGDLVAFHGWIPFGERLLARYRSAHAFVHVSLTEGVPRVLIEALCSGLPVVATGIGGVRWLLEDGAAGLLVPPDDLESLVAAVLRIAGEPQLRDALVARALELGPALTREAQAARVASFLGGEPSRAGTP